MRTQTRGQTSTPTQGQNAGWSLWQLEDEAKVHFLDEKSTTYTHLLHGTYSLKVADPSPSTMERGQQHGTRRQTGVCKERRRIKVYVIRYRGGER